MKTIKITEEILKAINVAIKAAVQYEKATGRKLGITGEVTEVLVADRLKLELLASPIYPGCDAVDSRGKLYQIKGARKLGDLHNGRIGKMSKHKYDFLVVALMNFGYELKEIYKLPYAVAEKIYDGDGRNPHISSVAIEKYRIK